MASCWDTSSDISKVGNFSRMASRGRKEKDVTTSEIQKNVDSKNQRLIGEM